MKLNRAVGTLLGGVALLASSACADLDVANPNNPDIRRALSSPEDVVNIANSTLFNWYRSVTYLQPFAALSVTSDNHTANFGNFGMRFNNVEPRIPYDNSSASGDAGVAESPWENSYADLGLGNDVMIALKNGISLGSPEEDAKYAALAQFTQAASLSSLAQLFDQAFIVDENTDLSVPPELKPHAEVAAAAEAKWDALIASLATQDAEYDAGVLPLTSGDGDYSLSAGRSIPLTSATLAQLANTLAAQHLAYMPRNAAENEAVNWGKVLQYAENGISKADNRFDFAIMQDGGTKWFSYVVYYGAEKSWMRTDMRLMNLMNPALPAKYDGNMPPEGTSADARYASDYGYDAKVEGDPARGIYMQSPFWHSRYDYAARLSPTNVEGPAPLVLAAENDLLIAEALIRTGGDLGRAASLINNTRVGRGHLPPASAADGKDKLLEYLFYERQVELQTTSGWNVYADMRRFDKLQPGTMRHLPIPASELETLALPIYTFGGEGKPDMRRERINGLLLQFKNAGGSLNAARAMR